jgi:prepilin-type N-terminal cleavage/methylation domain-containing protein
MKMKRQIRQRAGVDQGFTLVEMLIATAVVLVGLVAVAQLVPVSVMMNSNNRNDGMAMVFAQQQMEALREQPLTSTTFTDPTGETCFPALSACNLGDPTQPNVLVGSSVVVNSANQAIVDFSAPKVSGYNFTYIDPNDPTGSEYDVRWAVITVTNGQIVTGKRFIVGVFRRGMKTPTLPVTLDSMVEK